MPALIPAPRNIQKIAAKIKSGAAAVPSSQNDIIESFKVFVLKQALPFLQEKNVIEDASGSERESAQASSTLSSGSDSARIELTLTEFLIIANYVLNADKSMPEQRRADLIEFTHYAKNVCVDKVIFWDLEKLKTRYKRILRSIGNIQTPLPEEYRSIFAVLIYMNFTALDPKQGFNLEHKKIGEYCRQILDADHPIRETRRLLAADSPIPAPKAAEGELPKDNKDHQEAEPSLEPAPSLEIPSPPAGEGGAFISIEGRNGGDDEKEGGADAPEPWPVSIEVPRPAPEQPQVPQEPVAQNQQEEKDQEKPEEEPHERGEEDSEEEPEKEEKELSPVQPKNQEDLEVLFLKPLNQRLSEYEDAVFRQNLSKLDGLLKPCEFPAYRAACQTDSYNITSAGLTLLQQATALYDAIGPEPEFSELKKEFLNVYHNIKSMQEEVTKILKQKKDKQQKALEALALKTHPNHPYIKNTEEHRKKMPEERQAFQKAEGQHDKQNKILAFIKARKDKKNPAIPADGFRFRALILRLTIIGNSLSDSIVEPLAEGPLKARLGSRVDQLIYAAVNLGAANVLSLEKNIQSPVDDIAREFQPYLDEIIKDPKSDKIMDALYDFFAVACVIGDPKIKITVDTFSDSLTMLHISELKKNIAKSMKTAIAEALKSHNKVVWEYIEKIRTGVIGMDDKDKEEVERIVFIKDIYGKRADSYLRLYEQTFSKEDPDYPEVKKQYEALVYSINELQIAHQEFLTLDGRKRMEEDRKELQEKREAAKKTAAQQKKLRESGAEGLDMAPPLRPFGPPPPAGGEGMGSDRPSSQDPLPKEQKEDVPPELARSLEIPPPPAGGGGSKSRKGGGDENQENREDPLISSHKDKQDQRAGKPVFDGVPGRKQPRPPASPPPQKKKEEPLEDDTTVLIPPPPAGGGGLKGRRGGSIPWKGIGAILVLGLLMSGLGVGILAIVAPSLLYTPILATALSYGTLGAVGGVIAGTIALGLSLALLGLVVLGVVSLRQNSKIKDRKGYELIDTELQKGKQGGLTPHPPSNDVDLSHKGRGEQAAAKKTPRPPATPK